MDFYKGISFSLSLSFVLSQTVGKLEINITALVDIGSETKLSSRQFAPHCNSTEDCGGWTICCAAIYEENTLLDYGLCIDERNCKKPFKGLVHLEHPDSFPEDLIRQRGISRAGATANFNKSCSPPCDSDHYCECTLLRIDLGYLCGCIKKGIAGCFSGASVVMLKNGKRRKMSDLEVGDSVLTVDDYGRPSFSPMLLNLHKSPKDRAEFLLIQTNTGQSLTLTPNHLIYTKHQREQDEEWETIQRFKSGPNGNRINDTEEKALEYMNSFLPDFAGNVKHGDWVLVHHSIYGLIPSKIVSINKTVETGVYSPLTSQGNIVVDEILASCYSDFDNHAMQHLAWSPYRWWNQITEVFPSMKTKSGDNLKNSEDVSGTHWYGQGLHTFARSIFPWKAT